MSKAIFYVSIAGAGYWLYNEYQASEFYGAPMFSEQLRLLREQDSGLL